LGVTPSGWGSGQPALQIGSGTAINNRSAVLSQFSSNQYWNGSNHIYLNNGTATLYTQNDGAHSWATALSGSAGGTISFTQAMTLDSSGNLGIGTSSPTQKFDLTVTGANNAILVAQNTTATNGGAQLRAGNPQNTFIFGVDTNSGGLTGTGNASFLYGGNHPILFLPNATERMRITSSGALCIGTSSATNTRLNVVGGASLTYWEGGNSSTNITSGTPDQMLCKINNATVGNFWMQRFLNNSGGNMFSVGAQTTSATANFGNGKFFIEGQIRSTPSTFIVDNTNEYVYLGYSSSNGSYRLQVNGQIFATSSTIATSDGRYKENVQDLTGALDLVKVLRPVSFNWKKHNIHNFNTEDTTVGFIAQEVQQAMADKPYLNSFIKVNKCTSFDEVEQKECDEEFMGLAETNMIAILTKALQELNAKFDAYVASHP